MVGEEDHEGHEVVDDDSDHVREVVGVRLREQDVVDVGVLVLEREMLVETEGVTEGKLGTVGQYRPWSWVQKHGPVPVSFDGHHVVPPTGQQ